MSTWGNVAEAPNQRDVTVTRVYDAPARLVFKAWTEPAHLMQWFGPEGWPVTLCEVDFRVGGHYRMAMTGPNGEQSGAFGGEYFEIVPNERLVLDDAFEAPGSPKMLWTVTFDEKDGKTTLTIHILFWSIAMKEEYLGVGMLEGLGSALDQLAGVSQSLVESEQL